MKTIGINRFFILINRPDFRYLLNFKRSAAFSPHCGDLDAKVHDIVNDDKVWCHLNFWQNKTYLHAIHPRVMCVFVEKIRMVIVEWAHPKSGFNCFFKQMEWN